MLQISWYSFNIFQIPSIISSDQHKINFCHFLQIFEFSFLIFLNQIFATHNSVSSQNSCIISPSTFLSPKLIPPCVPFNPSIYFSKCPLKCPKFKTISALLLKFHSHAIGVFALQAFSLSTYNVSTIHCWRLTTTNHYWRFSHPLLASFSVSACASGPVECCIIQHSFVVHAIRCAHTILCLPRFYILAEQSNLSQYNYILYSVLIEKLFT